MGGVFDDPAATCQPVSRNTQLLIIFWAQCPEFKETVPQTHFSLPEAASFSQLAFSEPQKNGGIPPESTVAEPSKYRAVVDHIEWLWEKARPMLKVYRYRPQIQKLAGLRSRGINWGEGNPDTCCS